MRYDKVETAEGERLYPDPAGQESVALRYFAVPLAGALTVETRASAKRWFGCDAPEVFQAAEHALDEIVSASIRAIAATTGTTGWQTASWSSRS
jgi:hypothetical protein